MIKLQSYLSRGLKDTGMTECSAVSTLLDTKNRLLACGLDEEAAPGGKTQYQEQVGHYQWEASTTHPDMAWAPARLGEFLANHSAVDEKALKHLK